MSSHCVFVTGGTGYIGRQLIPRLIQRGHRVIALVRSGSENRFPSACEIVVGNALDRTTFIHRIPPADTFVQLVGVAHPGPGKAEQFRKVDLVSIQASAPAAAAAGVQHFVYVSVAQPAPVMKDYLAVRAEGESLIRKNKLNATILRPWYVIGTGHRWPYVLLPIYWVCDRLPGTRESSRRLGLVTLNQMLASLVSAVESPAKGIQILEVPQIRNGAGLQS